MSVERWNNMTLEEIIKKYPKTDDCELQTLGELYEWQLFELKKFISDLLVQQKKLCSDALQRQESGIIDISINHFENTELVSF